MELDEALTQISTIRQQLARTQVFRGYRAAPVACSGLLALLGGLAQTVYVPEPAERLDLYLLLWVGIAIISGLGTVGDVVVRHLRTDQPLRREITWLAFEQFSPCVVAGALMTCVLVWSAPQVAWVLPGLWSILYSLGMFASYRLLPRLIFWVGVYYLVAGVVCLACCQGSAAFSPLAMALPFGLGQLASASILHWTSEPSHEQ
ncbi:MAG TPA: hypothetical protein VHB77_23345 [Planctomycetaceae bacterium]|nr:hypothetical protein [Planctomycetaceae bacterium]